MRNPYILEPFDKEMNVKLKTLYSDLMDAEETAFLNCVSSYMNALEIEDLQNVINFGKSGHYGDRFIDKQYFSHALRVSRFLAIFLLSTGYANEIPSENGRSGFHIALIAALLHNCFEKNLISKEPFIQQYGTYCSKAVEYMTVNRELMKSEAGVQQYYNDLASAPKWIACMRAFDKADNLLVLHINPDDQVRVDYLAEIRKCFIPLMMKKEEQIGQLLNDLCNWASLKPHSIPSTEEIVAFRWECQLTKKMIL